MNSVTGITPGGENLLSIVREPSAAESMSQSTGFDAILKNTMNETRPEKYPEPGVNDSINDRKAQPKDEITGINNKDEIRPLSEKNEPYAQNISENAKKNRESGDADSAQENGKSARKTEEQGVKNIAGEKNIKVDAKKDPLIKKDDAVKKTKDLMLDDMDSIIKNIDSVIDKLSGGTRTSVLIEDLKEIREKMQNPHKADDGKRQLLGMIKSLEQKLAALESRHNTGIEEKTQIHFIKNILQELTKKISAREEARRDHDLAQPVTEKILSAEHKPEARGYTPGEQRNSDERQGNTWNINAFKSALERGADKNTAAPAITNHRFREQVDSMIDRAKVVVKDGRNASFSLKLHPRELGAVNINLGLEQGVLHGRFLVETPEARVLLLQNLEQIRQELTESGISVGEFQVNVSSHQNDPGRETRENSDRALFFEPKDMSAEFEINTVMAHNGSINMII